MPSYLTFPVFYERTISFSKAVQRFLVAVIKIFSFLAGENQLIISKEKPLQQKLDW